MATINQTDPVSFEAAQAMISSDTALSDALDRRRVAHADQRPRFRKSLLQKAETQRKARNTKTPINIHSII
jgi:hypothetical protein